MKRYFCGFLCIILIFIMSALPIMAVQKSDVDDAKKKVTSLEEEKEKVEGTLKNLEGLKADAAAYVKQLDTSLLQLDNEISELSVQMTNKEADISAKEVEHEAAKADEEKQYAAMKLRIKYMYENGDTSYLDLLINSENMSQLLNRAEYISKISEYDRRMLDKYAATKEMIAGQEEDLKNEYAELSALSESAKAKQASVQTLLDNKKTEIDNYNKKIASAQAEINEYEKDIKAQENKIKAIEAEIKRQEEAARKAAEEAGKSYNTVKLGDIKFIWPCPASRTISSTFGSRTSPTEGASSNHQGIDIAAASGSSIVAAASGTVIISTYSYSAGNYIMISHGGGVYTVYMHCSQLLVSDGASVKQGQVIAKVGSTGYSTGPHLHFGIRAGGSYINPQKYVSP